MKFLIRFFILLLVWFLLYEQVVKPLKVYDQVVIQGIAKQSAFLLNLVGIDAHAYPTSEGGVINNVGLVGEAPVQIGASCDGLTVISIFVIFILSFPGRIKDKLWFIPLGMLIIHAVNVFRVSCLAWIVSNYPAQLQFNHDYTFLILVYGIVFLLWLLWVKRFSIKRNE